MASPKSKPEEARKTFIARRRAENSALRDRLKGRLLWNSSRWGTAVVKINAETGEKFYISHKKEAF